jgi:hypothetical protein
VNRLETIAKNCFQLPKLATEHEYLVGDYMAKHEYAAGHRSAVPINKQPQPTGKTPAKQSRRRKNNAIKHTPPATADS